MRRSGAVVAVACGAEFMVVLDASVVNVALPAIRDDLGVGVAGLQWVVTAYALVFGGLLLLGGRLADVYGVRRMFLAGLALFTAASVAGGLAPSPGVLVAARAVQAVGAAVLAPAGLTLITTTLAEGPRRVRALAVWTALASAGGAAGGLLGGVLTELISWRATLLVNLPVGVAALVVAARVLPADRTRPTGGLDVPGAVAATTGLASFTFAVSGAGQRGWTSTTTLTCLAVAAAAFALLVAHETRWARRPLVPPRLLRLRPVAVGNGAMLLAGAALMPMWFFLSLHLQQALGLSPLQAGLGFLPHTLITVAVGAWVAPRLMRSVPAHILVIAGCLLAAAGFWWQSRAGVDDGYLAGVLLPAVPMSVGGGLLSTPLTASVTSGVTDDDAGAASGLMNTTKQAGGAVGLAVLLTVAVSAGPPGPPPFGAGFALAFELMAGLMVLVAGLALALRPRAGHIVPVGAPSARRDAAERGPATDRAP